MSSNSNSIRENLPTQPPIYERYQWPTPVIFNNFGRPHQTTIVSSPPNELYFEMENMRDDQNLSNNILNARSRQSEAIDRNNVSNQSNNALVLFFKKCFLGSNTTSNTTIDRIDHVVDFPHSPPPPPYFTIFPNLEINSSFTNNIPPIPESTPRTRPNNREDKVISRFLLCLNALGSFLSTIFFILAIISEMKSYSFTYILIIILILLFINAIFLTFISELCFRLKYKQYKEIIRSLYLISLFCSLVPLITRLILQEREKRLD